MFNNTRLARLRDLLRQMEAEVGLDDLSHNQRELYYAACLVANTDAISHSEEIRLHPMLSKMARPTFYLALRDLVRAGWLTAATEIRDGVYRIVK